MAETRSRILGIARALFTEHGYEMTSLRTIANASGITLGAVVHHWSHKDALFEEAMGRKPVSEREGAAALEALRQMGETR